MLLFCPTCGRLVTLEEGFKQFKFVCGACGFKMPIGGEIRSRLYPRLKDIDDVLGGPSAWENAQQTEERCPKCEHERAYFMQLQTRSADEPSTIFYRCANVDCGHRWKD
uniref:DNA-directed RNA polymerase subunit n=1 Tax=Panagrellus redivivus TaxID=6233 RepID=A0A7E4UT21_PANRE